MEIGVFYFFRSKKILVGTELWTPYFNKKILRKIMGAEYRESSSRVVAWDNTALAIQAKNVRPVNGLFWGEPQVARLM